MERTNKQTNKRDIVMEWFSNKNSKGIRIAESGKFLLVESGILVLESGIQLKESRIILTTGIQNPSSTDKDWNPVCGIRNLRRGIHNPRLSWILLQGTKPTNHKTIS